MWMPESAYTRERTLAFDRDEGADALLAEPRDGAEEAVDLPRLGAEQLREDRRLAEVADRAPDLGLEHDDQPEHRDVARLLEDDVEALEVEQVDQHRERHDQAEQDNARPRTTPEPRVVRRKRIAA